MPQIDNNIKYAADAIENAVELLFDRKQYVIVAIDGRCASGKTTLAEILREKLSCNVFHMDDFFLRSEQRTEERLNTPGENVDHERFLQEVLVNIEKHEPFSYRPFDCGTQSLRELVYVVPNKLSVIEGSYSCNNALWKHYDLRVFLDIDKQRQMQRIISRNGAEKAKRFANVWIPLEEAYFSAYDIKTRCDMSFVSTDIINELSWESSWELLEKFPNPKT